jgi:DNA modification methylase
MTVRIITAHVLEGLAQLEDESVHCVVTSPPYYGLRDYGIEPRVWGGDRNGCAHEWNGETVTAETSENVHWQHQTGGGGRNRFAKSGTSADQARTFKTIGRGSCLHCSAWRGSLGLEPTLDLYLDHMVEVFCEVRRVLRKDGTVWLNIGDSYCASPAGNKTQTAFAAEKGGQYRSDNYRQDVRRNFGNLKPKDLMLIPSRLAIRLCDDGWWVRSDIAWCKKAPMPESCTDRPTSAWEHVFLLTKSAKYFYDAEAVKEDSEYPDDNRKARQRPEDYAAMMGPGGQIRAAINPANAQTYPKRNLRNFWLLGPEPFPEAHFATFPTEIPRRAILAGTSERGVCPKCGAPWERVTARAKQPTAYAAVKYDESDPRFRTKRNMGQRYQDEANANPVETIGWRPTCSCAAGDPVPATCCDPFLGAGTTALVADRLGRHCIGIELSPQYAEMSERRLLDDAGMFAEIAAQ